MVSSAASDVSSYLAEVPQERREVLAAIRDLCRSELTGFTEAMEYGMPSYRRDGGDIEVAFASQKQYISLYVSRPDVMDAHAELLAGLPHGKGCIRYRRPAQVDLGMVRTLLRATAATPGPVS
jgi:uncharacterized protein YdhG (YjbR/CyaY superfamily)